jgi:ferric enterobactin receptor
MDRKLRYTLLFILISAVAHGQHQSTKDKLKRIKVDHFFTCTLDQMMDTLAANYDLAIVFERDSLAQMDITEHFFDESLAKVLKFVCKENHLQYWIENDGTIYILQQPDDLPRLKLKYELNQTARNFKPVIIPPPVAPPKHYMFALTGRITDQKTGESLPGASVRIRGTDLSALTNTSGNFTILNIPSDTSLVEVSFTGYQPDVFRLDSSSVKGGVNFSLYPSLNALSQVVITGKKKGVLNTDSKKGKRYTAYACLIG